MIRNGLNSKREREDLLAVGRVARLAWMRWLGRGRGCEDGVGVTLGGFGAAGLCKMLIFNYWGTFIPTKLQITVFTN